MHFVHTRNERTAIAVDRYLAISRRAIGRLDTCDSIAVNNDVLEFGEAEGLRIKDTDVANANRRGVLMSHFGLDLNKALRREFFGVMPQLLVRVLVAFANNAESGARDSEEPACLIEKNQRRVE